MVFFFFFTVLLGRDKRTSWPEYTPSCLRKKMSANSFRWHRKVPLRQKKQKCFCSPHFDLISLHHTVTKPHIGDSADCKQYCVQGVLDKQTFISCVT